MQVRSGDLDGYLVYTVLVVGRECPAEPFFHQLVDGNVGLFVFVRILFYTELLFYS